MEFRTLTEWDENLWPAVDVVYKQAFSHGRKSREIVQRLLEEGKAFLHVALDNGEVIAMALSADLREINALLIDYMGVREDRRNQAVGLHFVNCIGDWALRRGYDGMVIEVESTPEPMPDDHPNERRVRFWDKCGFSGTPYLHDYRIVPELYRAMYRKWNPSAAFPTRGETLFQHIARYHKAAWGRR